MMSTTLLKFLRNALFAFGVWLTALQRAKKKEIRAFTIKRALKHSFALSGNIHLHSPQLVRSRYNGRRLRIHTSAKEEFWT
jgi:hypothetical protein